MSSLSALTNAGAGENPVTTYVPASVALYNFSFKNVKDALDEMVESASQSSDDNSDKVTVKKSDLVAELAPTKSAQEQVDEMLSSVQGNLLKLSAYQLNSFKTVARDVQVLDLTKEALNQKQVKLLAQSMPCVRFFTCKRFEGSAFSSVKGFRNLSSLTVLDCKKSPISGDQLLKIKGLPLRGLSLSHTQRIDSGLHHFPFLERIDVGTELTRIQMGKVLQEHPALTEFNDFVLEKPTEDELFELLEEAQKPIHTIYNLACQNLRDETFQKVVKMYPTIEMVELYGCRDMTDSSLQPFKQLKGLGRLELFNADFTKISKKERDFWMGKRKEDKIFKFTIRATGENEACESGGPEISHKHCCKRDCEYGNCDPCKHAKCDSDCDSDSDDGKAVSDEVKSQESKERIDFVKTLLEKHVGKVVEIHEVD